MPATILTMRQATDRIAEAFSGYLHGDLHPDAAHRQWWLHKDCHHCLHADEDHNWLHRNSETDTIMPLPLGRYALLLLLTAASPATAATSCTWSETTGDHLLERKVGTLSLKQVGLEAAVAKISEAG